MTLQEDSPSRPGSTVDLSRRMDRMEISHEALAREVGVLTTTISRVEMNQNHAEELNKLRFDALGNTLSGIETKIGTFITRVEGILSGEISTAQSKVNQDLLSDYRQWRGRVDAALSGIDDYEKFRDGTNERLEEAIELRTQVRLLGRIAIFATGGSLLGTILAIYNMIT